MKIVAMDLGKGKSVACFVDHSTGEQRFETIPTRPPELLALLERERPDRVAIEAGPIAGWVSDACREMGIQVQVANVNHEMWRWKNVKHKSDRNDAAKLLKLSERNELPMVHMPRPEVRSWRELIAYRCAIVARITAMKNAIRAILTRHAETWPPGARGFGMQAVKDLGKMSEQSDRPGQIWRELLKHELTQMAAAEKVLADVELTLAVWAERDPRVALLRTIPGVGPRLAEILVATIDDPKRFAGGKQVACYAGLTPRRYQSGSMDRQGGISGQGPRLLRSLLVEVSWLGRQHNPWMKSVYENALRGSPSRKKIAIVALARRLLVVCWAMLRDNKPWRGPTAVSETTGVEAGAAEKKTRKRKAA